MFDARPLGLMALHDFKCPQCGHIERDRYVPITQRASEVSIICVVCEDAFGPAFMQWIPQVGSMDAREPFAQSTVYVRQPDGTEKPVVIGSLAQMRKIEHESEQRAKDGEGQQMVWRDYANDRGTGRHLEHSFAPDPSVRPEKNPRVKVTPVDAEVGESSTYGPG